MNDISELVDTIRDYSRELEDRHNAFATLVRRYQDMAFACAYAVLGDFYLAEDCAQEAFITAWQSINQLRAPEAFAGWLRRIVLTRCSRLTRGQRLRIVPLEQIEAAASATANPQAMIEQSDVSNTVLAAIRKLPANERIATTMFYVNGYTQTEIGEFLDVPETTVNKRLYSARQRLKKNLTFEALRRDLQARRPSRNESFALMVAAKLRPFGKLDWAWLQTNPGIAEQGNEAERWLETRRKFDDERYVRRHYVAEHAETARLLGYGCIEQSIYLPRYRLILMMESQAVSSGVAELLIDRLIEDLHSVDATTVTYQDFQSSPEITDFLKQKGFTETARINDYRLALKSTDVPLFSDSIRSLTERAIVISTLAHERETDPHYVEKLYRLTSEIAMDDPAHDRFTPPDFNEREARLWLEQPYVLPHGYFIAKDREEYVGVAAVNLREGLPQGASFGFIGVKREYRREEMAKALAAWAIDWSRRQGFETLRSLTSFVHPAIPALHKTFGFEHELSYVTLEKRLKEIAEIDAKLYDNYAGTYQDIEKRPDLLFTVKNENGRLTLECIGQKVELFPQSASKFFCTPFYGEFTFETDDEGNATHLNSRVRSLDQPESVLHARRSSQRSTGGQST